MSIASMEQKFTNFQSYINIGQGIPLVCYGAGMLQVAVCVAEVVTGVAMTIFGGAKDAWDACANGSKGAPRLKAGIRLIGEGIYYSAYTVANKFTYGILGYVTHVKDLADLKCEKEVIPNNLTPRKVVQVGIDMVLSGHQTEPTPGINIIYSLITIPYNISKVIYSFAGAIIYKVGLMTGYSDREPLDIAVTHLKDSSIASVKAVVNLATLGFAGYLFRIKDANTLFKKIHGVLDKNLDFPVLGLIPTAIKGVFSLYQLAHGTVGFVVYGIAAGILCVSNKPDLLAEAKKRSYLGLTDLGLGTANLVISALNLATLGIFAACISKRS